MKMIEARIEEVEAIKPTCCLFGVKRKEDGSWDVPDSEIYIVHSIHGYVGQDRIVYNLNIYGNFNNQVSQTFLEQERSRLEKMWNTPKWQETNGSEKFFRKMIPRSVRREMMEKKG